MPVYTLEHRCEMVVMYGACQRNARAAARMFNARFPHHACSHNVILRTVERLRRTGQVQVEPHTARVRVATNELHSTVVLAHIAINPHTSTRATARVIGISQASVVRILQRYHYHAYHVHLHQGLCPADYQRRFDYCNWMLNQIAQTPAFLQNILFTDEAKFTRDGNVNTHNAHYWSPVNPYWMRETRHQVQWSINVWCGIHGDRLVGPVFYDGILNGQRYLDMILRAVVEEHADNLPLRAAHVLWLQQDGAPPHYARLVWEWLDRHFPGQWIGRAGPVDWPPRSPDITPIDFFLWGYIKTLVYETAPPDLNDLQQCIRDACGTVTPVMLRAIRNALVT